MFPSPHHSIATAAFPIVEGDLLPRPAFPLSLEISVVEHPLTRDDQLNIAVNRLIPAALEHGQGILVVEHDYGQYTVRVDPEVPCGTTRESRR